MCYSNTKRELMGYSTPVFLLASTGLKLAFALIFLIAAFQKKKKMAFSKIVKLHYLFWLLSTPSTLLPFVRIFKKKEGTSTTLGWSALHFACQNTALFLGWHGPPYSLSTLNWGPWGSKRCTHFYLSKPGHDLEQNFWEVLMELLLWLPFIDRFCTQEKLK